MTKILRELKHLVLLSVGALVFLVGAVTVQAATYYVATTGNDTHACATAQTISTPLRTIASGVACLNPGDTLYIRSGTWTEQIDTNGKSGTAGNYITIAAYPGETVIIRPSGTGRPFTPYANQAYLVYDGFVFDGINAAGNPTSLYIYSGMNNIIVQNCEIKNWKSNGIYIEGNNITIRNNRIHDQVSVCQCSGERWYGIYFHNGSDSVIEGNDIYKNPGGGIHAYPGIITNLIIRNNKIHDNNTIPSSPIGGVLVYEGTATPVRGVQIYNNLIYKNGSAPTHGEAPGIRVSNGVDGTKVWNNTVYGNAGWGIKVEVSTATNTVVQNNIVYENTMGQILNDGTGTILSNNLTTDPSFMNVAAFDFNLRTSSRAIDAGAPLSDVKTDFRMNPRPRGATHDIGAYEVDTGSDSVPPVPPLGLRVN